MVFSLEDYKHSVFPCIVSAETNLTLDLKIPEFSVFSEFLCNKFEKKGGNYSREEILYGQVLYKESQHLPKFQFS